MCRPSISAALVAGKIEASYAARLLGLPADTQLLVLVAAAEPLGDPVLMQGAGHRAGCTRECDPLREEPASHEAEHLRRRVVEPLRVVDDDDDGLLAT